MSSLYRLKLLKEWVFRMLQVGLKDVGFEFLVPPNVKEVVLVSNSVALTDSLIKNLKKLENPLFVYHNHAAQAEALQMHYPDQFHEILFIMRRDPNGFWGLDDGGKIYFKIKNPENFFGVALVYGLTTDINLNIHPKPSWFIETSSMAAFMSDYPDGKVPTIGFVTRHVYSLISVIEKIYTIGFNLDDSYVLNNYPGHAWGYEKDKLKSDFALGAFEKLD